MLGGDPKPPRDCLMHPESVRPCECKVNKALPIIQDNLLLVLRSSLPASQLSEFTLQQQQQQHQMGQLYCLIFIQRGIRGDCVIRSNE